MSLSESSNSLIGNANLISKVYFPRLIVPAGSVITSFVDFLITLAIMGAMMVWYQFAPDWRILTLPLFVTLAFGAAFGAGLWLCALNVEYRDFRYIIPFVVQFGLYVSPVGFSSAEVPEKWRLLYSLNPMVGVIDGFRWASLRGETSLWWPGISASVGLTLLLCLSGVWYFRGWKNLCRCDLVMSDPIIKVESLGKKYRISHQGQRQRYVALRDVLANKVKGFFRKHGKRAEKQKSVEDFWALKDVSFEIKRGEVVGIIGRNGAGKSTLLKILSRITEPTEGRITLRGRVASLLEVGTGFHPELTGRENIFLNGAILGMSRAEIKKKFDEIVAFAEVEKFLDTPVKRYSSGMYVRLAFAVAAHLEPEILIVDEVLAVGDAEFQKKCMGKMENVARNEGRTVLFVSHNMAAVRQLCSKGIVLRSGNVKFIGNASTAIESYSDLVSVAHEVSFAPRSGHPTITSVKINPSALAVGSFELEVGFESPIPLVPPVPGFVIHSASGVPVYGSNPRFQGAGYNPGKLSRGIISFQVEDLPLCGGHYRLSVWLGDWQQGGDYDHHSDVLAFEFKNGETPPNRPSSDITGYIDLVGKWQVIVSDQRAGRPSPLNEPQNA